jgi:propanol-preferring alcohol dehydrogenase
MRLPLLTYREQAILGSFVGTLPEQYEVVALAKKGKIDYKAVVTKRLKLEEATEALEALEKGQVLGRGSALV